MRREWHWALAAAAALAVGALCAEPYARLAAPYYAATARLIAQPYPWEIASVQVGQNATDPGTVLRLTGFVRAHRDDPQPMGKLVSKLQVGALGESPVVFWTILLLWPATAMRQRFAFLAVGIPTFLLLEAGTTVCQLLSPLAYGSAVIAGNQDPITAWERWSRFLEAGGRVALAAVAALLTISLVKLAIVRSTRSGTAPARQPFIIICVPQAAAGQRKKHDPE